MSDVPIFDDAYWQRRLQERQMQASLRYMESWAASLRPIGHDSIEELREDYALGKIDFDTFERRLDRIMRP